MKYLLILLLLFITSCETQTVTVKREVKSEPRVYFTSTPYNVKFTVITIDGCEYLYKRRSSKGFLAHKGNCKNHTKE